GGGEYIAPSPPNGPPDYAASEIFDPATNQWLPASTVPDMPEAIKDTPAAMLGNGQILTLAHSTVDSFLLVSFGVAPHWVPAAPRGISIFDNESSSQILQDGSVLVGAPAFQRYIPATNT